MNEGMGRPWDEAKFVAAEKIRLAKEAEQREKERLAEEERRAKAGEPSIHIHTRNVFARLLLLLEAELYFTEVKKHVVIVKEVNA